MMARLVLVVLLAVLGTPAPAQNFERFVEGLATEIIREAIQQGNRRSQGAVRPAPQQTAPAPSPAPAASPAPERSGDPTVAEAQRLLNDLGYDAGPIDGLYGPRTAAALAAFQEERGLLVDGLIDAGALLALRDPPPVATATSDRDLESAPLASAAGAATGGPSFDCSRARVPTEFAICGTPSLSALDRQIAEAYAEAVSQQAPAVAESVRTEQRSWLAQRDSCAADIVCLDTAMRDRIRVLSALAGGGWATASDLGPAETAVPSRASPDPKVASLGYDLLYRLRLRDMAEMLADPAARNDSLVMEHYYFVQGVENGADCPGLERQVGNNEIARLGMLSEARALLIQRLPEYQSAPRTARARVEMRGRLGEYDFERQAFPVEFQFVLPSHVALRAGSEACGRLGRPVSGAAGLPIGPLSVTPPEKVNEVFLPMVLAEAERFLSDTSRPPSMRRTVTLSFELHLGPSWQRRGGIPAIESRVVGGTVSDPVTGRTLAAFRNTAPAQSGATSGADLVSAQAPELRRLSRLGHAMRLLAEAPELLDGDVLRELTAAIIRDEQNGWQTIDQLRAELEENPRRIASQNLDPRRPVVVASWQDLAKANPDLAAQALAGAVFAEPVDRSALAAAENLDPSFDYRIFTPVFRRESVEGRIPEIAAVELDDILHTALTQAARTVIGTQERLRISVPLRDLVYDVERQAIRPERGEELVLLEPARRLAYGDFSHDTPPGDAQYFLPEAARDWRVLTLRERFLPEPEVEGKEWVLRSIRQRVAYLDPLRAALIALDRSPRIAEIPLSPAEAERRLGGVEVDLYADLVLDLSGVMVGTSRVVDPERPKGLLRAELVEVRVRSQDGGFVAALPAEAFPTTARLAADAEAAERAAAEAEATAAAAQAASEARAADFMQALFGGEDGLHLIMRAGTERIEEVRATQQNAKRNYRIVLSNRALDLPAEAEYARPAEAAAWLRGGTGRAIVAHPRMFELELLPVLEGADLVAIAFPPSSNQLPGGTAQPPEAWARLAESDLVFVETGGGAPDGPILLEQSLQTRARSRLRSAMPFPAKVEDLGITLLPEISLDGQTEALPLRELAARLAAGAGRAIVPGQALAQLAPGLANADVTLRRFPTESFKLGIAKDHEEGPDAFEVLGVKIGMSPQQVRQAVRDRFNDGEIDVVRDALVGRRGSCERPLGYAPASSGEEGTLCLVVTFRDGAASRIRVHQVLPGEAEEAAEAALRERFGRSTLIDETRQRYGGAWTRILGWGAPLVADRAALGRIEAKLPPTVAEAVIWSGDGATALDVQLDDVTTAPEPEAAATPEIEF